MDQRARNFLYKLVFSPIYVVLIKPKSLPEDKARRELILNIFLAASIILLFAALILAIVVSYLPREGPPGNSPLYITALLFSFVGLLIISRKGYYVAASYIFIAVYLAAVVNGIYTFGIDEPETLLGFALLIVMTGVLISSRFAFLVTFLSILFIIILGYAQSHQWYVVEVHWKQRTAIVMEDIIMFSITFSIIAVTAWLSNREIEKSLARARRSEADLKKERDSLEVTVEARTRELKETQAEKMTQLYRFAEFGRLSSGLFHDLINPLTAVSLNIEKVKNVGETKQYVDKAISAARKMEDMVSAVRKQLSRQETKTLFSVNEEIAQALEVLSYKAKKSGVAIRLFSREDLKTYGDAVKFNQVALNLIANAIDAYLPAVALAKEGLEKRDSDTRTVTISLSQKDGIIIFEVKDKGDGISEENRSKLFDPFFTTKRECGMGIGLSIVKRIVEKDFGGSIEVASKEGEGSAFTVKFPQKQNE